MESIKHIFKTPKDHEILLKIPNHIPENSTIEVILNFQKKPKIYEQKINKLRDAVNDNLFLNDLKDISDDFENNDLNEWQE